MARDSSIVDSMTMGTQASVDPLRIGIVGLGRIYDLNILAYRGNPDVEICALVDANPDRLKERSTEWPHAVTFASVDALIESGIQLDGVEVLLPIPLHAAYVPALLEAGWHVNLQKPVCSDLDELASMRHAMTRSNRSVRVMENYVYYEPLQRLKELVDDGEIGEVVGYHMKMVASGLGGWEVPGDTYEWQFLQHQRGRGTLLFDDGWHKLATALWLFGPVRAVRAWIGETEIVEGIGVDAPTTVVWEHESGIRGVWDITLAVDLYLRSDYYTNDERWEVTGRRGFARVNRCTARGIQEPSLEVYRDGIMTSHHSLDDDWASSFANSGRAWVDWLREQSGPVPNGLDAAEEILRFALAAYESSLHGGVSVSPETLLPTLAR
jgi:predicted dehydrogenase